MAEGFLRELGGETYESLSAGAKPAGYVHPLAVRAMQDIGFDISSLTSQSINEFLPPLGEPPDLVISVCSATENECPIFPGQVERQHWPFDDPADAEGNDDQKMVVFQRVRDEIREAIVSRLLTAS